MGRAMKCQHMHRVRFFLEFFLCPTVGYWLVAIIPAGFGTWSIHSAKSLCESAIVCEVSLQGVLR
jgi:hypothetical protein